MNIERKVVWIIDDEADLCVLLKAYFLRKNYEVRVFHRCTEIFSYLTQAVVPDLVLFDPSTCDHPNEIIDAIKRANSGVQIRVSDPGEQKYNLK